VARPEDETLFSSLVPGSESVGHFKALLYAAGEYERLAEDPEADEPLRQRTAGKARHLRERAAE
jgi:PHD/YefM family antitoxin component YafN of YafNO toxin-antitoxin module